MDLHYGEYPTYAKSKLYSHHVAVEPSQDVVVNTIKSLLTLNVMAKGQVRKHAAATLIMEYTTVNINVFDAVTNQRFIKTVVNKLDEFAKTPYFSKDEYDLYMGRIKHMIRD